MYIFIIFFHLLLAATVAEYGSKIYVFSDAVPRNDVTIRYIQAMQSEKDLTISLLLTGQCKQKRSIGKYLSKEAVRIIHIVNKGKFTYEKNPKLNDNFCECSDHRFVLDNCISNNTKL